LPEFLCNLAATLAAAPMLRGYADLLAGDRRLQQLVTIDVACRTDAVHIFRTAICDLLHQLKAPDNGGALVIAIDAIDEAEFHRPENGDSIASFIGAHIGMLPVWIRFVVTCRSENMTIVDAQRRLQLDDCQVDERVLRDTRLYIDYR
jgi:hypothetical protein